MAARDIFNLRVAMGPDEVERQIEAHGMGAGQPGDILAPGGLHSPAHTYAPAATDFSDFLNAAPAAAGGPFDDFLNSSPAAHGNELDPNVPVDTDWSQVGKPGFLLNNLAMGSAQLAQMLGAVGALVSGNPSNDVVQRSTDALTQMQKDESPEQLKLEQQREADIQAAGEGKHNKAGRFLAEAGTAIWDTLKSPTLLASFALQQAPQYALVGPTGRLAATVAEKIAARKALEEAAAKKLVERSAIGTGVASEGVLQGADTAQQTQQQLLQVPDAVWQANPDIMKDMASYDDSHPNASAADRDAYYQQRKTATIVDLSRKSFTAAALIAMATNFIPGATSVERALVGQANKTVGSRARQALVGGLGEAASEGIQEGPGGALLANVATAQVNPSQDILQGVGEQTGMGAVFGAPGAVAAFINPAEKAGADVLKAPSTDAAIAQANAALAPTPGKAIEPTVGPTMTTGELVAEAQRRLDAIDKKASGTPDQTITGPDGKDITYPGVQPEILTDAERAERLHIRQNLDNPATLAQRYGIQLAPEGKRDFASTQVALDPVAAQAIQAVAQHIAPEDIHDKGVEQRPHITVKYGLKTENPADVQKVLADEGHVAATVGNLEVFKTPEADVLVQRVDSPDLDRLHKKIMKAIPNEETFPDYKPHITIAYLKPGTGEKYLGLKTGLEGETLVFPTVEYSGKGETLSPIELQAPGAIAPTQGTEGVAPVPKAAPESMAVGGNVLRVGAHQVNGQWFGTLVTMPAKTKAKRAVEAFNNHQIGPFASFEEAQAAAINQAHAVLLPATEGNQAHRARIQAELDMLMPQSQLATPEQRAAAGNKASELPGAMGSMGKAISEAFYEGYYKRLAREPGSTNTFKLERSWDDARAAFDRGEIKSPADLKAFLEQRENPRVAAAATPESKPEPKTLDQITLSTEHETESGTATVMQKADKVASRLAKRLKTIEALLECVS